MHRVFILILNYNGWRDTVECLESVQPELFQISHCGYDNGSADSFLEKTKVLAVGELSVESKFFTYDPSTKPVRWIENDRDTAGAGGLP